MATHSLTAADWELWHSWMEAQRLVADDVDEALRSEAGVSKAEFSILRTLGSAPEATLRVVELAAALRWEKSRVAHLLTRMEHRGLIARIEDGAPGRRTAVRLSSDGRNALREALRVHEKSVSRIFTGQLTNDQAAAIRSWSERIISAAAAPPSTRPPKESQ
ncbi:MarR family winged helix-turn-helix transcriptional regulator [Humibacter ginsengiterrae]|jgi:DNA-binding MarR family transcriptional regulator